MKGGRFSAATSGKNSIIDSTGAPSWYASSSSSVCNKTHSAWPCWCFWNMLPDNSVSSQSFKQGGWEAAWSLDTILNLDFNLQNPLFLRCLWVYCWKGELRF